MSSQKNKQSMGDLFMQQRRDRAASSAPSSNLTLLSSSTGSPSAGAASAGGRKQMSFAEIQREQEQQRQQSQGAPKILKRPDQPPPQRNSPQRNSRPTTNSNSSTSRQISQSTTTEQGTIHTLLDKFGFIHCADRPAELFFHYTSTSAHWDDLNIGDEVEFRVGPQQRRGRSSEEEKLCALDVRVLPKGTIAWEREDEEGKRWRGSVDRLPGSGQGRDRDRGGDKGKGVIKVEGEDGLQATFLSSDYASHGSFLGKADVVEFSLVTERRTGMKFARNITLIRSERDRLREEREAKLLESATVEQGVVVSDKGDFGFIRSVCRDEEVYFRVSNVLADDDGRGMMLKEGQEVEFYVIDETAVGGSSGGGRKKSSNSLSARKIKLLPKGTVKFEEVLASGVTGMVVDCPIQQGMEPFGGSGNRSDGGKGSTMMGKIRLDEPMAVEGSDGEVVSEVMLHPDLYPGGTFAMNRVGSEMGVWIRPGDVLLFDVIKKISDGSCRALPTKFTQIASLRPEGWTPDDSTKPAIRLVELALMGRTEGFIRSIKDDYAFIHCVERNVDAYMKLYEVFPMDIYADLTQNNPALYTKKIDLTQKGGHVQVEVGMEVSFDLSLQMLTNHLGGMGGRVRGGRNNKSNIRSPAEKESLRARRVQILPKGTVKEKIGIATEVRASITKEDPRQQFSGTLELEESLTIQTSSHRYPYVSKLLDCVSAGKYGDEVMFNDILSEKDALAIISMVNASNDLEWSYVPLPGESVEDSHHRKLCIARRKEENAAAEESEPIVDGASDAKDDSGGSEAVESAGKEQSESKDISTEALAKETARKAEKKKRTRKEKVITSLRYDRSSLPDLSNGPLGTGDVITCDLYLSRSSGQVYVENIHVIERKERAAPAVKTAEGKEDVRRGKNCTGYVTEVVPNRQFGFITGVDENGSKTGDHVFFHFNEVVNSADDTPQDESPGKIKKVILSDVIRKGDEVKFDAGPGKNNKLTATAVTILPRGTLKLPSKVDKSTSCTGYILLEPSHTSLANTPSHVVLHGGPSLGGAGRWDNVGKEGKSSPASGSNIQEEGVILLLTDPSHLFSSHPQSRKSSMDSTKSENGASDDKPKSESDDVSNESAVGTHVRYKLSSLAFRGPSDNASRPDGPRRGDLVIFGKTKGAKMVKDIRIEKLDAATTVKGVLIDIKADENSAVFVSSVNNVKYNMALSEVVSCEKSLIKENQEVDGVLHEGKIYGVCRTKDIFLTSSLAKNSSGSSNGPKQRPKLNLTVKKELQGMGGQIMAQSKMAKGPDGTTGFVHGWTKRLSPNVNVFVPANIPDSGFDSSTHAEESGE